MTPQLVIWILIIAMLGVGIFALRGALKNSFKDVELKKAKARLLRDLLGETGYRYFVGILGGFFIAASLTLAFLILGGGKMLPKGKSSTDIMEISLRSDDANTTSTLMVTEAQLKMKFEILGDTEFVNYQHLSLKNNYRNTLPELVWKMKNLESIDLTNNEFTELPLQQFSQLPNLKRLTLDGNPMEPAYVEKIKSTLTGIEVVKNESPEPSH